MLELGHRVRDGRARGEHDVAAAPVAAQVLHFIRRSSHLAASLVCMPGTEPPDTAVLEVVGLVDEYRVAADLFSNVAPLERL